MIDLETADLSKLQATMDTDKGRMVIRFHPKQAPNHVRNFLKLAQEGFYDGLAFHRIIRSFMIQGGCPNTRKGASGVPGTGGPGWKVGAEFNELPHQRGVLSMARSRDPNSAGSQFFIVHAEHVPSLDGQYTVFGQVVEGLDVLDGIASVEVDFGAGGERSVPRKRVEIRSVTVSEIPAEAAS
ncbi:MAG: peptidylprolyl isomerase [Planctomycetes bacterium]|nr:peptidylprolyl isomerase [Planctomycetota bacterium]